MTFCDEAWERISTLRERIATHPFLVQLQEGTLERDRFLEYLTQDALYLGQFARALAFAAAKAPTDDEVVFWSQGARQAIAVERVLHERWTDSDRTVPMSATCQAYTDFILATAATGSYATLVAALLPCHWVYQDVGARLCGAVENIDDHPYGDWIAAYADPEFAAVVDQARQIANTTAESEGAAVREQMLSAFVQASRYEWMFWDAALHDSRWPIPT